MTYTIVRDVLYLGQLTADIYKQSVAGRPVLGLTHGGGWDQGSKEAVTNVAAVFATQGFNVVNINYTLTRGTPQQPIDECRAAIRWTRSVAAEYGWDAAKVYAIGLSAGAHLWLMAAMQGTAGDDRPDKVNAWSSPCNLGAMVGAGVAQVAEYIGASYADDPELWDLMSPTFQITSECCPIRIVGSAAENTEGGGIARSQYDGLHVAALAVGVPVVKRIFPGSVHATFLGASDDVAASTQWLRAA